MKNKNGTLTTTDLTYIAFSTTLICVCAWLRIPLFVPVTLQSFAIFLSTALLGGKRATLCVLLYIALGAIGLPVFSGFAGGPGILFSTTGGYILGFLFIPLLCWLGETINQKHNLELWPFLFVGLILCYALGTFWYISLHVKVWTLQSVISTMSVCVLPFILPDILKLFLAIIIAKKLKKRIRYH